MCTSPIDAWPASPDADSRRLVFNPARSYRGAKSIRVPCGKCVDCRLAYAREWAIRCVHESTMHEASTFATFTYSDENLPSGYSISKRDLQLGHKRIRENHGPFRYFACGEHGEAFHRPHYHSILFGLDFPDKVLWDRSPKGEALYRSPSLEKTWGLGRVLLGDVTFQSSGYVARYSLKKHKADDADAGVLRVHPLTGELVQQAAPFLLMSRRPGLGSTWFDRFAGDVFPSDFVVINGQRMPVPQFYKDRLDERAALRISAARKRRTALRAADNTERRLLSRHESSILRAELLRRGLEEVS